MTCSQCNEEYDEFELTQITVGLVCEDCIIDQTDMMKEIESQLKLEYLETQANIERDERSV